MKHIIKWAEPPEFTEWKNMANEGWQPCWDNLAGEPKEILREALLTEQGYICCYCGQRIEKIGSHIEHLKPRRDPYTELALEYSNLLASCLSNLDRSEPRHCGHAKDKWYDESLMISPLDQNCESRFRFTDDGDIFPYQEGDIAAQTTIEKLKLKKLRNKRKKAIEAFIGDDKLSSEDIEKLISKFQQFETGVKYYSFCHVLVQVLQGYV